MNNPGKLFLIWAAILAALMLSIKYWGGAILNPNTTIATTQVDGRQQIVLDRDRQGHYLASGYINGEPVRFFVDTGATAVAIPLAVANRLNLTQGYEYKVHTANGTAIAYHTSLATVSLGGITLNNIQGSITPGMDGEEILLGMSFLKHLDFAQRSGKLILSIPE